MKKALTFLFLLIALVLRAQTYSGYVADEGGHGIADVSVLLRDGKKSPISFTRSNASGYFSVALKEGRTAQNIALIKMGYETMVVKLDSFQQGATYTLQEKAIELKEVKVRPDKIRQSGDTLVYNVLAFKQKQDRSIADVIAKMPGLEVGSNGQITYQGHTINKFYVEGMDLMGGQYAQISENLTADKVKSVQVLQNHQPVRALKDVRFSDQAALNIVLRDDAKNVWQGVAELGIGVTTQNDWIWLRDARLMAMFFSRKVQSVSMYKTNNTGKDIQHEIADLFTSRQSVSTDNGLLSNINLGAPTLDASRYTFNNSHVIATNWLFKTSKNNDLRLQLNGFIDKTEQQRESEVTYTDTGDGTLITQEQTAFSKSSQWKGELLYKINNNHTYLSNSLKGYMDFDYSRGSSILNGTQVDQACEAGSTPVSRSKV